MMTLEKFMSDFDESDNKWFSGYRKDWMSDDQWLCFLFLQRLFKGFHHIPTPPKPAGRGIEINFRPQYFATYDYDMLTKMVIMSHNWGVRVQVGGSGPAMIKITLHKRHKRSGCLSERIPRIEEMIKKYKDF